MLKILKQIFQTATLRQTLITTTGTILNGILGFLFYTILAKNLGPESFGLFVVSITTLTLVADIVDLGVNSSLVKFVSINISSGETKMAYRFLKLGLQIKLAVWFLVLLIGEIIAPFIAAFIFQKPELVIPLRIVFIGVGGAMFFSLATSTFQSLAKFKLWSGLNIVINFLRLTIILVILNFGFLNLQNSLIVYITSLFLGFFISLVFLPTKQILSSVDQLSLFKSFFDMRKINSS